MNTINLKNKKHHKDDTFQVVSRYFMVRCSVFLRPPQGDSWLHTRSA